jgi:hypothetical protein
VLPYWLLFSVFSIGAIQSAAGSAEARRTPPLLVLAGLLTALMIGLRFKVGGDWANYDFIFENYGYGGFGYVLTAGDPGYGLLNWLAHQLGLGIWSVNLVCGIIFTWGLLQFAKTQPNPWLVCLIAVPYLVVVVAMGYTRQAVAIGVILGALRSFSRGSITGFVILLVLATAFHKSAVVIIPMVGLAFTRNRALVLLFTLSLVAILYWLFVSASAAHLTEVYTKGEFESEGALIRVIMAIVPALLFLPFQSRFGFSKHEQLLWRNLSIGALVALFALLTMPQLSTLIDRLALYLIPLQLAILSRLPLAFPGKRVRGAELVLLVISYSAAIQFVWLNYAAHAELWIPYQLYSFGYDKTQLY